MMLAETIAAAAESSVLSLLDSTALTISLIALLVVCVVIIVVLVLCQRTRTRTKTGIVSTDV